MFIWFRWGSWNWVFLSSSVASVVLSTYMLSVRRRYISINKFVKWLAFPLDHAVRTRTWPGQYLGFTFCLIMNDDTLRISAHSNAECVSALATAANASICWQCWWQAHGQTDGRQYQAVYQQASRCKSLRNHTGLQAVPDWQLPVISQRRYCEHYVV